jgi:hypothetical protein
MTQAPAPPPMPTPAGETMWYCMVGPQQVGPVSVAGILSMIQAGTITGTTMVWREGLPAWTPAGGVPELAYAFVNGPKKDAGLGLTSSGLILFIVLALTCLPLCWIPWMIKDLRAK